MGFLALVKALVATTATSTALGTATRATCATMVPDLDVIAFRFGILYAAPFGHPLRRHVLYRLSRADWAKQVSSSPSDGS
ncbi:MAG: hypothetical protein E6J67_15680 [Deltaproteobacteria bacterium]|nr:MAG: hypothetical protein E6J67_15680 [Deltaproteobacteria bacterium]